MATVRAEDLLAFDEGDGLARLRRILEDPRVVLDQIGILIVKESGKAFREQKLGNYKWRPRKVPNMAGILSDAARGASKPKDQRFRPTPALIDTGLLARSIAHRLVGRDTVEVGVGGAAKTYADVHQVGGTTQTVPISQAVQERLWEWMKSADGSAKGIRGRKVAKAKAGALASDGVLLNLKAELKHAKKKANVEAKRSGGRHRKYDGFVADLKEQIVTRKRVLRGQASASVPSDASIHWGGKETRARAAAGLASLRWLLNKNLRGHRLNVKVPARPFIGLPPNLVGEIERTLGVHVRAV
jgi:phage gpG-like protein